MTRGGPRRRKQAPGSTSLAAFGAVADDAEADAGATASDAVTVSAIVAATRARLENAPDLQGVWVRGEVSGFTAAASGHWYFTLKDEHAQLRCVMWRGANARVPFDPDDGMDVLVRGSIGVYVARGTMQMQVAEMEPAGRGALWLRFEQLKQRLGEEGLFDEDRKQPIPMLPRTVGVVTSRSGAVWHDIRNVARRRHAGVRLVLAPVRVQGEGAAEEIAAAIRRFDAHHAADVLIVGRGGGSMEDLWAFNEEAVVRAIADARLPVVSAVGHETDWTLADFVADVRAATPSQAAEFTVPDAGALLAEVRAREDRLRGALRRRLDALRARFESVAAHPALARPDRLLGDRRQRLDDAITRLPRAMRHVAEAKRAALATHAGRLDALSPLAVLSRGYAVARHGDGRVVRDAADVQEGEEVEVVVSRGRFHANVTRTEPREESE